jgi:hypothetical protein
MIVERLKIDEKALERAINHVINLKKSDGLASMPGHD